MNYKLFTMNYTYLKKLAQVLAVFAVVLTALNFGTYNPYQELAVLAPDTVVAQGVFPTRDFSTLVSFPSLGGSSLSDQIFANGSSTTSTSSTFSTSASSAVSTCVVTSNLQTITTGSSVIIDWTTEGYATVTINGEPVSGLSGSKTFTNVLVNTTYTLVAATADGRSSCTSSVTVLCLPPVVVPTCTLTPVARTITTGGSVDLTWTTTNAATVSLSGFGTVASSSTQNTGVLATTTNYTLTVLGTNGQTVTCDSVITVVPEIVDPLPTCDAFTAAPTTITRGATSSLTWATTNASRVVINNGIGEVTATGTLSVTPLATTVYQLTVFGIAPAEDSCLTTVTVQEPEVTLPVCEFITATPSTLPIGGGNVTLNWSTTNATAVTIAPTIGTVPAVGSTVLGISTSTNFTLNATAGTSTVQCAVNVPVATLEPTPISCANNVSFTASPSTVVIGNAATLAWSTIGITSVSFDSGITATGLSGSLSVSPSGSTTYTLFATTGTTTIACPVAVTVSSGGGGGGGSNSPRCELSVSDNTINSGESVELIWGSTRATELIIEDQTTDEKIVTTENLLGSAKDRYFDGSITVSPNADTTYLLTVKRGSTTRTCKVSVDIVDNVVVTQERDQQPLVASISLAQVPYTGFEAGPILTLLFYTLLMAWALYVAYLLVISRDSLGGLQLATQKTVPVHTKFIPELIRPDVFVAQVKAPEMPVSTLTPHNLPTGVPVIGYANQAAAAVQAEVVSTNLHTIDDVEMTRIENHAHANHVLLSSDAIRHFIATTATTVERTEALDQVMTAAKSQFPAEDGWIVLNEKRMQELCLVCATNQMHSSTVPYLPAVIPEGAGSLAEAIVTGNVVASYEMIGHRPMFALADAAADLDAIYRIRRGETAAVSEMLAKETATLTDAQILQMIKALTGALDGTYTDEASAVKMSIMKAIKVVA